MCFGMSFGFVTHIQRKQMLKRSITYKNFEDEEVTEIHYFHLSEVELVDMEVKHEGGLKGRLERLVEFKARKDMVDFLKDLILDSFGEKTPDGRGFEKNEVMRKSFSQTTAYNTLFMELIESDKAAVDFMKGILPKRFAEEAEKAMLEQKTAEALGKPKDG